MKQAFSFMNMVSRGWEVSLLAILPFLKIQYNLSLKTIGFLSTVYAVLMIIMIIIAPFVSKKFSARNGLIFTLCFFVIAWLLLAFGHSKMWVVFAYIFGVAASGMFQPIYDSITAQSTTPERRSRELGMYAAWGDIGRIGIVAFVTFLIPLFTLKVTGIVCACITVVMILIAFACIQKQVSTEEIDTNVLPKLKELRGNRRYKLAVLSNIFDGAGSSSLYIFIPFLLILNNIDVAKTGLFTAILFAGYLCGRLVLSSFADTRGPQGVLVIAEISMAVLLVLLINVSHPAIIMIIVFLLGVFTRGTSPIIKGITASTLGMKGDYDYAFSVSSLASRGSTVGARSVFGIVADSLGIKYVFLVAASLVLCAVFPILRTKEDAFTTDES